MNLGLKKLPGELGANTTSEDIHFVIGTYRMSFEQSLKLTKLLQIKVASEVKTESVEPEEEDAKEKRRSCLKCLLRMPNRRQKRSHRRMRCFSQI